MVALLLSLVGGVFLSRHLSRPLRDIATAATEIAAGNLALQLPVRGTAEAATVAQAFNAMSVSLSSAHERLVHDAIHDHLTQLPNRSLFKERLDRALARRTRRHDYQFAVLFVDLDRFKHVNDSLGHTAGDRLLVMFAERLAAAVRSDDVVSRMAGAATVPEPTLARFGGDEFAVLLDGIREPFDAVRVAKRVQQMATQPLPLDGQDVFASASIGVAVATDAHSRAKTSSATPTWPCTARRTPAAAATRCSTPRSHDEAVRRLRLETDLRRAVERREFRVWYQPIVSLGDHRSSVARRWSAGSIPSAGWSSPGSSSTSPKKSASSPRSTSGCCRSPAGRCASGGDTGVFTPAFTVSVNLVGQGLRAGVARPACLRHAAGHRLLGREPAPRDHRERRASRTPPAPASCWPQLRALGVRISLDDFGTGYSSLSYLQSLPLDILKIDRSFVAGIGTDKDKGEIVKLIVGLARTLGLEIVAEGTETAAQVEYLRAARLSVRSGLLLREAG